MIFKLNELQQMLMTLQDKQTKDMLTWDGGSFDYNKWQETEIKLGMTIEEFQECMELLGNINFLINERYIKFNISSIKECSLIILTKKSLGII